MSLIASAALIFSGIAKAKELFSSGKKIMSEIKGAAFVANTEEELRAEFEAMDPELQSMWIKRMEAEVERYEKQTKRLRAQEEVSPEIARKVDAETASKITYMRKTTRPWAVIQMVRVILFPFYLIGIDVIQHLIKSWLFFWTDKIKPFDSFQYVFGVQDGGLMDKLGNVLGPMPKTLAGQMYIEVIGVAVWVIITYMGLREAGKYRDKGDGDGLLGKIKKTGFLSNLFGGGK